MSSAARTMGRAATCARALRSADTEGRFRDARDELAGVLRDEAIRVLLMNGVPAQAREDLARAVTLNVLGRILDGVVEPGFEDGYLAVAAKNRARDWHRKASGVYEKTEHYDEELLVAPDLDPCSALELADDDTRALADRIVLVLQSAPALHHCEDTRRITCRRPRPGPSSAGSYLHPARTAGASCLPRHRRPHHSHRPRRPAGPLPDSG